jgi:hypothetical protein
MIPDPSLEQTTSIVFDITNTLARVCSAFEAWLHDQMRTRSSRMRPDFETNHQTSRISWFLDVSHMKAFGPG